MRLRYIHLPDYGPLQNVAVVFEQNQHIEARAGAVNFVIGLNGTGKSSLLRAIYDVFHSLSREKLPEFPVTLAYDRSIGVGWDELDTRWDNLSRDEIENANKKKYEHQTVIFHRPKGAASQAFLVGLADSLSFPSAEDWQLHVENELASEGNADSLGNYIRGDQLKGDGNLRMLLPSRVLAYTTGEFEPWDTMAYPAFPKDELSDDPQDFIPEDERPQNWTEHQEYYDVRIPTRGDPAWDTAFGGKKDPSDISDRCMLLNSADAELAAVSLGIWNAAIEFEDLQQEWQRAHFRNQCLETITKRIHVEDVARRILNEMDWLWPTHASFRFTNLAHTLRHRDAARCYWLFALASAVVRQPLDESLAVVRLGNCPPISPYDILGGQDPDPERELLISQIAKPMANAHCMAEAIRSLFAGEQDTHESFWTLFSSLREWRNIGLLKEVDLTVQRLHRAQAADGQMDDRIHSYGSFSDGERMLLGRVAFMLLLQKQQNTLLLLDEPETHFNDAWKRQLIDLIDDGLLKNTTCQVLVSTHTSLALTDVFSCEITRFVKNEGSTKAERVAHPTFGADPGRILLHVFGAPDVIGARAAEFLREKLRKEWEPHEIEKLENLIDEIGSGWPRAKLIDILDKLEKTDAP